MIKLRIPTQDPYAFIEVDLDIPTGDGHSDAPERVQEAYRAYFTTFNGKSTVNPDFCAKLVEIVNSDLTENWGTADDYQALSVPEQAVMQALKRLKKRLGANE